MRVKFFKFLIASSAIAVCGITVTSCSSDVRNYGIYARISSNYQDSTSVSTTGADNSTSVSTPYANALNNIFFDNFNYSSSSSIYGLNADNTINSATALNENSLPAKMYSGLISPLVSYINALANLYIYSFSYSDYQKDANNYFTTSFAPIIKDSNNSNNNDLLNFIYSYANTLATAKMSQTKTIKFGITGIQTKFSSVDNTQNNNTSSTDITSGLFPVGAQDAATKDANNAYTVNADYSSLEQNTSSDTGASNDTTNSVLDLIGDNLVFIPKLSFQLSLQFGFWWASTQYSKTDLNKSFLDGSNVANTSSLALNASAVNDFIDQTGYWNPYASGSSRPLSEDSLNAKYSQYLTLNYTFRPVLVYSLSSMRQLDPGLDYYLNTNYTNAQPVKELPPTLVWTKTLTDSVAVPNTILLYGTSNDNTNSNKPIYHITSDVNFDSTFVSTDSNLNNNKIGDNKGVSDTETNYGKNVAALVSGWIGKSNTNQTQNTVVLSSTASNINSFLKTNITDANELKNTKQQYISSLLLSNTGIL
ncbi:MAG: hypothetical protein HUJ42_03260 [Malacoplasma sp.]|nr:hypothetical protein [Malacoplasma sp.]